MLPAVIRTSFPGSCVIFRLWKCSCSTRIHKSPPLTPIIAVLYCYHKPFAYSRTQKGLCYHCWFIILIRQKAPWGALCGAPSGHRPCWSLPTSPALLGDSPAPRGPAVPFCRPGPTPAGTWLPGARSMLCESWLISPGTAFVFQTAKCQLRHRNAERSRFLLCWRGGSCSPGHSGHWGVSRRAGAQHDSVTP